MRHIWVVALALLVAGCGSDTERPEPEKLLTDDETAAMPTIDHDGVIDLLKKPKEKAPRLLFLWHAHTEAKTPCLAKAEALAKAHQEAGLEVIALNLDLPDAVRERALPLLRKVAPEALEARAFQGDIMLLGRELDPMWGGQTPAVFLYDKAGTQVSRGHGPDALAGAEAKIAAALAGK